MKKLDIAMIGFGTVGQGLAEILLSKKDGLAANEGVGFRVVAISDLHKGAVANAEGLDLTQALAAVSQEGGSLNALAGGEHGFTQCSPPGHESTTYLGMSCTAARACRGSQLGSSTLKAAFSDALIGHGSSHLAPYLLMLTCSWQGSG